ncbi:MAG: DNA gyrase subunit A, partial [Clostridia bacterium]|nr:DNA gyrase subunit A [Clostridia bacterium]
QEQVIERRVRFDLEKAIARAHIYEGYKIALDNIDEIVQIMKSSKSIPESKATLMERFGLSDPQAQAIVEMTLGKLTGMERQKIEDELARLHALIADLRDILANEGRIKPIIKDEMTAIKDKYGDKRRTEIVAAEDDIILEDLIEKHNCIITLTHAGYIKRQPADTYEAQHRGGKGIISMTTKEEDFIEKVISVHSHSYLMMFTNIGKVYMRKAYMIPEASRTAKGTNIVNILELSEGEKITAVIGVSEFAENEYLTMVTQKGVIKRTPIKEYEYQRKGGKIAINLDDDDKLVFVRRTDGSCSVVIATHDGNAIRFDESNARAMGRTARGVRGISLRDGDYVVGVTTVDESQHLITVTEKGFGKRSEFADFREMKNRGGMGVKCHNITEKTGELVGIATVSEDDDLMIITDQGQMIRTPVAGIPVYSRAAGGVIVMRLGENQKIVNFTKVAREEKPDEDGSDNGTPEIEVIEKENTKIEEPENMDSVGISDED